MERPKVSIIVPVYNVEKYLGQCIESILSQTFEDFEVLLINDGSTDSSGVICDEYKRKDSRIKVLHKENGGLSSSRNKGIEMSKGDWAIFIDSDDVWRDENVLYSLVECAEKLSVDILRFEYLAVDEDLKPIEPRTYDKSHIENRVLNNYELVKYGVAGEWFAVLYLIRKSVIEDFRFDEAIRFQEDIDFYCRLFAQKDLKCSYIDRKMYLYRKRSSSITTSPKIENLRCSFNLCDTFYDQSKKIQHHPLKNLYSYYSAMMYYWTMSSIAEPPYCHKMNTIIEDLKLYDTQRRVRKIFIKNKIPNKGFILSLFPPLQGVRLLQIRNRFIWLLNKLIDKRG